MYEDFGAVVDGSSVEFRVFFPDAAVDGAQYVRGGTPHIKTLKVAGDFQARTGGTAWDVGNAPVLAREEHPKGWLYKHRLDEIADGFYQYKYFVEFENGTSRWCGDPCSKYGGSEHENAAFVVGGNRGEVKPIDDRLPLGDLVLYEMMIDDFTAGFRGARAPLDAIRDKLGYLQELGVNAVEFMPWTAWPGSAFSWGYDPVAFFSVEHRYSDDPATPLDKLYALKVLINELHGRGIHVIMDGVFNHVQGGAAPDRGFPYFWFYQDPTHSPFIGNFGEGGFFNDLDFRNECTAEFVTDVCKYWLDRYCVDGIRFDYVRGFYQRSDPPMGIARVVRDLNVHAAEKKLKNIALILEFLTDTRYEAVGKTNEIQATGCWFDPLMHEGLEAARGNLKTAFVRAANAGKDFDPGRVPVTYIENHDHSTITEVCGGRDQWWMTQPLAIALMTCCGAPMLHNGQEFGEQYQLPEQGPGRVTPRPLHWDHADDGIGTSLLGLYKKLIAIRKAHPALRTANFYPEPYDERWIAFNAQGYGVDTNRGIAIYHRWDGLERFIVVLNFSASLQRVDIPFSGNGDWQDLLNGGTARVEGYWLRDQTLDSHWGRIYFKLD
ncbi:MAG TPA: alpha-amylase family glycosyl hydrolase [Thermoanaerobaculia bacterium]|jgi:1,4-alpha-glucan branching enzyme